MISWTKNCLVRYFCHPRLLRTGILARAQNFAVAIFVRSCLFPQLPQHAGGRPSQLKNRPKPSARWTALSARSWKKRESPPRDVQATLAKLGRSKTARPSISWKAQLTNSASGCTALTLDSPAKDQTWSKQRKWWQRGRRQSGRTNAQRQLEAEQRSASLPAAIPGGMFVTMRRAWEANLEPGQTLSPTELPDKSFLEWHNTQVEFLAESLAEVASQQEDAAQNRRSDAGRLHTRRNQKQSSGMRRVRVKSAMPATTEQLRHKYRLLAVHWSMLCQRYPNKAWAQGYDQTMLRNHVDWLLGDQDAELCAMAPTGEESISPSWPVVLRYELEVRKEAMRQLNMCGVTLAAAFAASRRSDELRTRYLITPLALGGTQRRQQDSRPTEDRQNKPRPQQPQHQPQPKQKVTKRGGEKQRKREEAAGSKRRVVRKGIALQQSAQDLPKLDTTGSQSVSRSRTQKLLKRPELQAPARLRSLLWCAFF